MPKDPCDHSSDLEQARYLTRRLRGNLTRAEELSFPARHYVRFLGRRGNPAGGDASFGISNWHQLLDDCMRETGATAAFVMGGEGLVIAVRGGVAAEQAQAIGARLMIGLDQAEQLNEGGAATTLCAEVAEGWVSALRFEHNDTRLLLAVVGGAPLDSSSRRVVAQLIQLALPKHVPAQAPASSLGT